MTVPKPSPPRGWYADPAGAHAWRWWDGERWTDDLHAFSTDRSAPLTESLAAERRAAGRLVPTGLVLVAVAVVLGSVLRAFDVTWLSATWHWFGHAVTVLKQGGSASSLPPAPVRNQAISVLATFVVLPLEVVAVVMVLSFQYRAALAAKALGLPQRLNPVFGIISWFIPLASFILPWVAWSDLLPRSHPVRRQVLVAWVAVVDIQVLSLAAFGAATVSSTLVGVCSAAQIVGVGIILRLLPAIVTAVVDVHRIGAGEPISPEHRATPGT